MKIAWIVYGSLDERSGGTIYDAQIVRGLRDHYGDEVDVISLPQKDKRPSLRDLGGAVVRRLAHQSSRPDVVVGDELCFRELAFVFSRIELPARIVLVHHLTCWEQEQRPLARREARFWESVLLRNNDGVVATSHATCARLIHEGHRGAADVVLPGADRLHLSSNESNVSNVSNVSNDDDARERPLVFLFVGAISARKRVRELVSAFLRLDGSVKLRLVGTRDREPAYVRDIDRDLEFGLRDRAIGRDNITFLGEVDEATLARELADADVLVMPSSLEGYGIAATEAVRAKLPVIAASTPGLVEALTPCRDAVLFFARCDDDDDDDGLGAAMRRFATDQALRKKMRGAAVESALHMPRWTEAVAAFRSALVSAVDAHQARARPK